jgi:hypothetical protein
MQCRPVRCIDCAHCDANCFCDFVYRAKRDVINVKYREACDYFKGANDEQVK